LSFLKIFEFLILEGVSEVVKEGETCSLPGHKELKMVANLLFNKPYLYGY
jgi:hypothetical protein